MSDSFLVTQYTNAFKIATDKIITSLKINCQTRKIKAEESAQIASQYCKLGKLTSFDLNIQYNFLYYQGIVSLCLGLCQLSNLKHLSLNLNSNKITLKGAILLFHSLKMLQNLEVLDLQIYYNQVQDEGISYLNEGLISLKKLDQLSLNLESIGIKKKGALQLSEGIKMLNNLTILKLKLQGNLIQGKGTQSILQSVIELKNLKEISLNFQYNDIQQVGQIALPQEQFLNHLITLSLELDGNNFENDNAIPQLLQHLVLLKSLNLSFSCCSCSEVNENSFQDIVIVIRNLQELENLSLSFDQSSIQSEQLIELFKSIDSLKKLKNLSFIADKKQAKIPLAKQIQKSLTQLKNLQYLSLLFILEDDEDDDDDDYSYENLNESSPNDKEFIKHIAEGISCLENLIFLALKLTLKEMSDDSLKSLNSVLLSLKNLQKLSLKFGQNLLQCSGVQNLCSISPGSYFKKINDLTLNLSNNLILENGVQSIKNSLSVFTDLKNLNLNLQGNQISSGAHSLFYQLSNLKSMIHLKLNLSNTSLKIDQGKFLFKSLEKLHNLESLKVILDKNLIGECRKISLESINTLKKLKDIYLSFNSNEINSFEFNKQNPFLQLRSFEVDLQSNRLDIQAVESLILFLNSLKNNQSLEKLCVNFDFNPKIDIIARSSLKEFIHRILLK